jgi:hypothetical protein
MSTLTAKKATEKALCKICARRMKCDYNEFENGTLAASNSMFCGCQLRALVIKEWMDDMMGFEG